MLKFFKIDLRLKGPGNLGMNGPRNENSQERKFPGTNGLGNKSSP